MPGIMHHVMGRTAWQSLSAAEREAWALSPAVPADAPAFLKQEKFGSVEDKIARYSAFLDLMGWRTAAFLETPEFLLYGRVPVPHGGATRDLLPAWCAEGLYEPWACREVLRQFVPRLIDQVRRGEMEQAAITGAGVLAHYIEDSAAISHSLPNRFFYDIMPEETDTHSSYHPAIDYVETELAPVTPLLLGTNPAEVVFRLGTRLDRNYKRGLRNMVGLLAAARQNDVARMRELLAPCYQDAVQSVASLLHTALVLGRGNADSAEMAEPRTFDLTEAVPWWVHPGGAYGPVAPVGHSLVDGRLVPLVADLGRGPEHVERGLGMTSFVSTRYILEPGAFQRFTGAVGLSPEHRQDQEPGMDVEFLVSLSPEWDTQVTMDLEFAPPLRKAWACRLAPGVPATPFSVELGNARTLLVAVLPHPKTVAGRERCWFPHVALVNPQLVKD